MRAALVRPVWNIVPTCVLIHRNSADNALTIDVLQALGFGNKPLTSMFLMLLAVN